MPAARPGNCRLRRRASIWRRKWPAIRANDWRNAADVRPKSAGYALKKTWPRDFVAFFKPPPDCDFRVAWILFPTPDDAALKALRASSAEGLRRRWRNWRNARRSLPTTVNARLKSAQQVCWQNYSSAIDNAPQGFKEGRSSRTIARRVVCRSSADQRQDSGSRSDAYLKEISVDDP